MFKVTELAKTDVRGEPRWASWFIAQTGTSRPREGCLGPGQAVEQAGALVLVHQPQGSWACGALCSLGCLTA